MSSRQFSVTEPHPTVPRSGGYIGGGRGGAGNFKKYTAEELTSGASATGPASRIFLARPNTKRTMTAGRGGAGNMVTATEQSMFQFDEEMLKSRETPATPIYRIGRGGAGNTFPDAKAASSASARKSSSSSAGSVNERPENLRRESGGMFSSIFNRRSA